MKIYPNAISNTDKIVNSLNIDYSHLFFPRTGNDQHTGIINGVYSKFSTLKNTDMSDIFIDYIFDNIHLPDDSQDTLRFVYSFIQIQRYYPGDFIVPHFDLYDITKLYLFNLTSSDVDALIIEDEGTLVRVPDVAGQYIDFDGKNVHWVNPVKDIRYSLVIGN
jgi:hypothetical protein